MVNNTLQEHINEICDEFNFDRVQKTMEFLGWEWVTSGGVPTTSELRKKVRDLMSIAYEGGLKRGADYSTGTGGFWVEYFYEEDFFEVTFQLERWSTEFSCGVVDNEDEVPF